jgi:cytochrome P450
MAREAAALGDAWERRAGDTIDVGAEMMRVTLRIVGETLLGADVSEHYTLHRNERVWEAPERFRPERFLPGREEQAHRFAFLGFGGGPRVCIGAQFAQMEGVILLAELLQRVKLRGTTGAEIPVLPCMSLRPVGGMPMRIARRD